MSKEEPNKANQNKPANNPGSGIRSMRATNLFKVVNFELYVKPNLAIMAVGLTCFGLCLGYLAYMRSKYEGMGYYVAVTEEGNEKFEKKKSKWD